MLTTASVWVTWGMVGLAAAVIGLFLAGVRAVAPSRFRTAAVGVLLWVAFWSVLALSGWLSDFDRRPPPMALMVLAVVIAAIWLRASKLGRALARGLPLWVLVAFHSFRLPLELLMARAAHEGVMPVEMSFHGFNYDIVSGITAIAAAFALKRGAPRWVAWAFCLLGMVLLSAIVTIAIRASPLVGAFGGGVHLNTWVVYFPFMLLPTVLVAGALAGHLVLFKRLADESSRS